MSQCRARDLALWCGLAFVAVTGCAKKEAPVSGEPAIEVIRHTFLPRLEKENYWEPVKLERGEKNFLLEVHPRLKIPSEGPWTLTVRNETGNVAAREPGQFVDVATGAITLLCDAKAFSKGDWTIALDLEEGGRTSGPTQYAFRFRIE